MLSFAREPRFVQGPYNAEDLAWIPGTDWMITSGMASIGHPQGHLYLVDVREKTAKELFPGTVAYRLDSDTYGASAPPDVEVFCGHGIALRPGLDGVHTLYVVNHSGLANAPDEDVENRTRESIEVFLVDVSGEEPQLTWVGAIEQAPGVWGNAVAPLPDGGIVATNYLDLRDPHSFEKVMAGEISGNLKEWHPGRGWEDVPGSELSAPNGVVASADGRWLFVASWVPQLLVRLSRGREEVEKTGISVGFNADNVKWSPDGKLLLTGQIGSSADIFAQVDANDSCNFPFRVLRIDPETMEAEELVHVEHEVFGTATTALIVGDELWVGSARSDRVAYFPRTA
jgi:hypothetical protein